MANGDLTTLDHVKQWLDIPLDDVTADPLLLRMISAASRFVLGYLNRPGLVAQDVMEVYDGYGSNIMMLRQWPVISLSSIQFSGVNLTPANQAVGNPRQNGYFLESSQSAGGAQ